MKSTRWIKEEKLAEMRYFRKEDKASHKALTDDEIFDMRDLIVSGGIKRGLTSRGYSDEQSAEEDRKVSENDQAKGNGDGLASTAGFHEGTDDVVLS
jgi:hypothetical protein